MQQAITSVSNAPVGGKVVEVRFMSGQHYALIETLALETGNNDIDGKKQILHNRRVFHTTQLTRIASDFYSLLCHALLVLHGHNNV